MKLFLPTIALLCVACCAAGQSSGFVPVETSSWHQLGDKRIMVKTSGYGKARSRVLVNLHHNEITSLQAAQKILSVSGGVLIHIENEHERLITFGINGRNFRFDPNRIFTDAGIRLTLDRLNEEVPPAAFKSAKRFAAFLRSKIPGGARIIVAVHNNEEGDLSVNSYAAGGELQKEAQQVHQAKAHDADNFFLTTNSWLFSKLKTDGFNVVLQHNKKVTDDGSLSVYYARRKKMYINVEAEQGQLAEQVEMLKKLVSVLRGK